MTRKFLIAGLILFIPWSCFSAKAPGGTSTPIEHIVILFQENVSFDHYFGTYPHAENPPGEPPFVAAPSTLTVNGLTDAVLQRHPNLYPPFRLTRAQALTCDQDHSYLHEQQAMNHGQMDKFVEYTEIDDPSCDDGLGKKLVMGYYDGNTVTALWNYAQHFALNDNFFNTVYGPSTPGVLNLVSGQTHGMFMVRVVDTTTIEQVGGTVIGDLRPAYDDCVPASMNTITMQGISVADLLNARGVTWGWFQGGFAPTSRNHDKSAVCSNGHKNIGGKFIPDYIPHHEPFQYYELQANPHHLPPSATSKIGRTDQANHQYDLTDFWRAAKAGHLPQVSFLKAPAYQDGHAGYSDPLDEQHYIVETVNELQKLPEWHSTAVIITYDDSDGWYDHVMPPNVHPSHSPADGLTAPGHCGTSASPDFEGRCGYGPRLPIMVISPWARRNFVDHTLTDQSSILRFIEDNWKTGRIEGSSFDATAGSLEGMFDFQGKPDNTPLILDPTTGTPPANKTQT